MSCTPRSGSDGITQQQLVLRQQPAQVRTVFGLNSESDNVRQAFSLRKTGLLYHRHPNDSFQSTLDVFVPQAVDKGVQHRGDHGVHH